MGWHLYVVFFQNGVCICPCRINNECKVVQWSSFRLYSCWTIAKNKIYNINTTFWVVIECVNFWRPSSLWHYHASISTQPHSSFHSSFSLHTMRVSDHHLYHGCRRWIVHRACLSVMVPAIVMFLSKHHWANGTEVKYLFIEILQPDILAMTEKPLTRYLVYSSVPVT